MFAGRLGWKNLGAFCLFLLFLLPQTAEAVDFVWAVRGGLYALADTGRIELEEPFLTQVGSRLGSTLALGALGHISINHHLSASFQVDFGEWFLGVGSAVASDPWSFRVMQNGHTRLKKRKGALTPWILEESAFLREAYLSISFARQNAIQINIGVQRVKLADGQIYDDFGVGLFGSFDGDRFLGHEWLPWRFQVSAFLPDASFTFAGKKSPVFYAEGGIYDRRSPSRLDLFAFYLRDNDGLSARRHLPSLRIAESSFASHRFAPVCQDPRRSCKNLPSSKGNHFWFGIKTLLQSDSTEFKGHLVWNISDFTIGEGDKASDYFSMAWAFALEATIALRVATVRFFAWGQPRTKADNDGKSLLITTISPQARYSSMLFHGGPSSSSGRRISYAQWNRAIGALGWQIEHPFKEKMSLTFMNVFLMTAPTAGKEQSHVEFALQWKYQVTKRLRVLVHSSALLPGQWLKGQNVKPWLQVLLGVEFSFRSWT